jgi:hypothetical protein
VNLRVTVSRSGVVFESSFTANKDRHRIPLPTRLPLDVVVPRETGSGMATQTPSEMITCRRSGYSSPGALRLIVL